jgi:hypothetical protein
MLLWLTIVIAYFSYPFLGLLWKHVGKVLG